MAFSTFHYLAALCLLFSAASGQSPWAWSCNSTTGMCSRVLAEEAQPAPLDLMQCKMTWYGAQYAFCSNFAGMFYRFYVRNVPKNQNFVCKITKSSKFLEFN